MPFFGLLQIRRYQRTRNRCTFLLFISESKNLLKFRKSTDSVLVLRMWLGCSEEAFSLITTIEHKASAFVVAAKKVQATLGRASGNTKNGTDVQKVQRETKGISRNFMKHDTHHNARSNCSFEDLSFTRFCWAAVSERKT